MELQPPQPRQARAFIPSEPKTPTATVPPAVSPLPQTQSCGKRSKKHRDHLAPQYAERSAEIVVASKKPLAAKKPVATYKTVAKEPVVKEPVVKEPVAKEPVAKKPVAKEPVIRNFVAKNPVARELVAKELVAKEPVADRPARGGGRRPVPLSPDALTAFANGDPDAKEWNK